MHHTTSLVFFLTVAMDAWMPLRVFSRKLRREYTVLASPRSPHMPRRRRSVTLRRVLYCLACTPVVVLVAILCQGIPPSYGDVRLFERRLPQHSVAALTRADGRPARYLRFPGHLWGHGLNNVLQEACVFHPSPSSRSPQSQPAHVLPRLRLQRLLCL